MTLLQFMTNTDVNMKRVSTGNLILDFSIFFPFMDDMSTSSTLEQ